MSPKKAVYFSIFIRMLMVFFCISICFVRLIESDDETKQGLMEKDKKAFVHATEMVDIKSCKNLLAKGITVDGTLADGATPLHLASYNSVGEESFWLLKEILYFYGNPTLKDHDGRTSLHMACINTKNIERRNDVVGLLLLHGADINAENNYGRTVLGDIVTLKSKDNVENFLQYWGCLCSDKAFETAKNTAGSSAGIGLGYTDVYEALIVKKRSHKECAAKNNIPEIVLKLINGDWQGALEEGEKEGLLWQLLPEKYGKLSFLFVALLRGEKKCAKKLLHIAPSMDTVDGYGRNVLHIIASSCLLSESEKIKLLGIALNKGAKSIVDTKGNTIIHTAVKKNELGLIVFLKEKYKDRIEFMVRNMYGDRPVDIALRYGKTSMVDALSAP